MYRRKTAFLFVIFALYLTSCGKKNLSSFIPESITEDSSAVTTSFEPSNATNVSESSAIQTDKSSNDNSVTTSEISKKTKIFFDLNGGTTSSDTTPIEVETLSVSSFFFNVVKTDFNFRGWSYGGVIVFDEKGNQLSSPSLEREMIFVAEFSQTVKMKIETTIYGSTRKKVVASDVAIVTGTGEYPYNTNVSISAAPIHAGYVFEGWYYDNTLLSNSSEYNYMMWSEDVVLEARFKYNTFKLNLNAVDIENGSVMIKGDSSYSDNSSKNFEYNTPVQISAYSKNEHRFLGWYTDAFDFVETNAVYSFTMPNHDYNLNAIWENVSGADHYYGGWVLTNDSQCYRTCSICNEKVYGSISVGDTITFGEYEQDDDLTNGKEPISWKVLAIEDSKATVISEYALEGLERGDDGHSDYTWAKCSLRVWLNEDFYNSAFSTEEKGKIIKTQRSVPNNPVYHSYSSGISTQDNLWLLNCNEADELFESNDDRKCRVTPYSKRKIASGAVYNGLCMWWLETVGGATFKVSAVNMGGAIDYIGNYHSTLYGVRPALTIKI